MQKINFTEARLEELMYSEEYGTYIMEHSKGDRVICSGDTLLAGMENGYLFDQFIESIS